MCSQHFNRAYGWVGPCPIDGLSNQVAQVAIDRYHSFHHLSRSLYLCAQNGVMHSLIPSKHLANVGVWNCAIAYIHLIVVVCGVYCTQIILHRHG